MSEKSSINWNEAQLRAKGFIADGKNSFIPSKEANRAHSGKTMAGNVTVKEKITETPDFEFKPATEWFIKDYSVPSKKNSRQNFVRNGKQVSIPSKAHSTYKKMTAMQYSAFGIEFRQAVRHYGLGFPLKVEFTFIRSTRHLFDLTNACQTVEDLMVDNKWIESDNADILHPSFGQYEYDKNCPGVKIKLIVKDQEQVVGEALIKIITDIAKNSGLTNVRLGDCVTRAGYSIRLVSGKIGIETHVLGAGKKILAFVH